MTINRLPLWTLVAGAALSLRVAACGGDCPPFQRDDVYPLDMRPDGGGSSNPAPDAAVPDGGGATLASGSTAARWPRAAPRGRRAHRRATACWRGSAW